jgi:hypothetical protein
MGNSRYVRSHHLLQYSAANRVYFQRDGGQRPKVTDESLGCMANDTGREGGNMSALDRWLGETRKEEPWSVYSRTPDA